MNVPGKEKPAFRVTHARLMNGTSLSAKTAAEVEYAKERKPFYVLKKKYRHGI